ncbi:uronate dehydrogenase [Variovorax sp. OK605]|uniref:NAD-dependent epimerase/dehydratase family protein n=1 Tax=Variovorax sp. OK605 TaxID=1855317 RepID=UPI0008F0F41C|nr:NAD(P)-dependent oxidoreductase [Variovorax sp. OK605]SFP62381.1 uronate dehydrogenase [Variovorax sp. OK605]
MPTLLITGAAGQVGSALRPLLREHHDLRLFDRREPADPAANEQVMVGDLCDPACVARTVEGVDAILHLACAHGPAIGFDATVQPNYSATLYLLEAAQRFGVKRFLFASSHHVLGQHQGDVAEYLDDLSPAPDGYYGLSKVFGEAACAAYALRGGAAAFVIRIGNADAQVSDARRLRIWVSTRDLAQLVRIGLEHPDVRNEVVYGVSESPHPMFANTRARALGYRPQDNAQNFRAPDFLDREAMHPSASGRDHVGGVYAASPLAPLLPPA